MDTYIHLLIYLYLLKIYEKRKFLFILLEINVDD